MKNLKLKSAVYDILKPLALVVLPALSALYVTLGSLWNFSNVEAVVGTIAALDTFLGVILGIAGKNYAEGRGLYDGHVSIIEAPEGTKYVLELDYDPSLIEGKERIILSVGAPVIQG